MTQGVRWTLEFQIPVPLLTSCVTLGKLLFPHLQVEIHCSHSMLGSLKDIAHEKFFRSQSLAQVSA